MTLLLYVVFAGDPTFAGVVKDATGKPVAGAIVGVSTYVSGEEAPSAVTDAAGRFSIKKPPSLQRESGLGGLVAFHADHGLASRSMREGNSANLELRLAKGAGARIVVQDADGRPLPGARASVPTLRADERPVRVPPVIAERLAVQTGADGAAVIAHLGPKQISQIRIEPAAGSAQSFQPVSLDGGTNPDYEWRSIRLRPTTIVKGRFTGLPWPKGKEVTVSSYQGSREEGLVVSLESTVRPMDDGAFAAPALVGGTWSVRAALDGQYVTNLRDAPKATPGAPEKAWTLGAMQPVTGVVRTKEGKPVAGASVSVSRGGRYVTDAEGRFRGHAPLGEIYHSVAPPPGFSTGELYSRRPIEIKAGAQPVELPPLILTRAAVLRGVVKDDAGKPAAGARILAECVVSMGGGMSSHSPRYGAAGPDGSFKIDNIPEGAEVTLRAFDEARASYGGPVGAAADATNVALKLEANTALRLAVAATDESGKPIDGAEFRVEFRERYAHDADWLQWLRQDLPKPIRATGSTPVDIGAMPTGLSYQVAASAPGFLPATSSWTPGAKIKGPVTLKLRRALELTGRVVDSAGKPVVGALVKPAGCYGAEGSAATDSNGAFTLSGLPGTTAVVVAQCSGFRFGGVVATSGKPAIITLKRPSEPAPRAVARQFPAETTTLAKRLLDPLADAVFKGKGEMKTWWAQSYAYMDPQRLLEHLDGPQWSDRDREFARHHLASALASTDVDEAIAQAQAITASDRKAGALLDVANRLPATASARRGPLLADALTAARAGTDPARKALYIAKVGEALHKTGAPEGAKAIREAEALARKLAKDGWAAYAVGSVAESLALIDFDAAMELTKDLPGSDGSDRSRGGTDSYTFARHRGNMAHKIARLRPANAQKALASTSGNAGRAAAGVCYRMAPVDLPRAKQIAAQNAFAPDKAVRLCAMAAALGPDRKSDALPLIREAFAALAAERERRYDGYGNAPLAMALVYAAAAVAPDEADDFFWQALATPGPARPTSRQNFGRDGRLGAVAVTALLAERYDREIASALAASLKDQAGALVEQLKDRGTDSDDAMAAVAALLALCPEAREAMLKAWPPATGEGPSDRADYARLTVGGILLATPPRRNDNLTYRYLHQWYIDKEDL